jgi:pyruvate/2-oxoglutarate dehydrogenase complex dihydrolipoamide dehydrogenase (E3) component
MALVEISGDRILGFTRFGVGAGEIMSSVPIAMIAGLPYTGLREAVLTHPTLVEGLGVVLVGTFCAKNQRMRMAH